MWLNQGPSNPAFPPGYNPANPALPPAGVYPQPLPQQYPPVQYPMAVNPAMTTNVPPIMRPYTGGPGPHTYPVAPGGYPVAPVGGVYPGAYPWPQKGYPHQHYKGYQHYKGHHHNNGHLYYGGVNTMYPPRGGIGGALTGMAMGLVAHKAHKKLKKGKKLKKVHKLYKHGYYNHGCKYSSSSSSSSSDSD